MKYRFVRMLLLMLSLPFTWLSAQDNHDTVKHSGGVAIQLKIEGAIGPATVDYIDRNLDRASDMNAAFVLIRMDTPGGLDTSMRQIIKKIIGSAVPIVSYVAPSGARAASAGTYIVYASHVAAMAPATNLGAATPVQIGGSVPFGDHDNQEKDKSDPQNAKPVDLKNSMTRKMVNDAVAYIRGLAKLRGRNAEWAEKAVTEAASLPAEQALKENVIDLVAADRGDLLRKLAGRKVNVLGQEIVLATEGVRVDISEPDWRNELLTHITNPSVAYILMLIGIYGLIFEFSSPGAVVPGTIGGICLLLALFAFQLLPINYAGMALIILGIALMVAEAFVPSFGILGLGGAIAFLMGSVILIDTEAPGFGINFGIIGAFTLVSVAFFILALGMLLKSRQKSVVSGQEELIGAFGRALTDFDQIGLIRIHSENWRARTDRPLRKGESAMVKALDGLTLIVTPSDEKEER